MSLLEVMWRRSQRDRRAAAGSGRSLRSSWPVVISYTDRAALHTVPRIPPETARRADVAIDAPSREDAASAEREREGLHARSEELELELELEQPVADGFLPAQQLVQPLRRDGAVALCIDVGTVVVQRQLAVRGRPSPTSVAAGDET